MADERTDIIIQGDTAIWEMLVEGEIKGTYAGTFKFRCFLTPTQKIAADRDYREMLGNNPFSVNEHESFLAYALSQLKYRVIESPPFWTATKQTSIGAFAGDIPDENVLQAILDSAIQAEFKYKAHLEKKRNDSLERSKKAAERMLKQREEADEGEDQASAD